MELNESIKLHRQKKGYTQERLAEIIGVSGQAVSKWECGESMPDGALLVPLADALGISMDVLFGRQTLYEADIAEKIIKLIGSVSEKDRMNKIYELCWQIEKGLFNTLVKINCEYDPNELNGEIREKNKCNSSRISNDAGFITISLDAASPYFAVFPEPEKGWGEVLKYEERYLTTFSCLADEKVLKAVFWLYGLESYYTFDKEVLADGCGIERSEAAEVMAKLLSMGLVYKEEINIDGKERILYVYRPQLGWFAFLVMAYESYGKHRFAYQSECRNAPFLRKK